MVFVKLSTKLCEYEYVRSYADYSLFVYLKGDVFMALLLHVDDIFLPVIIPKLLGHSKPIFTLALALKI